jgi:hypothetical protein
MTDWFRNTPEDKPYPHAGTKEHCKPTEQGIFGTVTILAQSDFTALADCNYD